MNPYYENNESIEEILSSVSFEPSHGFRDGLQDRITNQVVSSHKVPGLTHTLRPIWFFQGIRRTIASSAIIFCMIMVSLFLSVPNVRAQVSIFLLSFGVKLPFASEGLVLSTFEPLSPDYVPAEMTYFFSANFDRPTYSELRYFSKDQFIIISESPIEKDETLPSGKPIWVGKSTAVLQEGLSGPVMLAAPRPQVWRMQSGSGGGGGGGKSIDEAPLQLDYTSGIQISWFQAGLRIDLLTNLPLDEALKVAESMKPAAKSQK
jgi:hypothetical protein